MKYLILIILLSLNISGHAGENAPDRVFSLGGVLPIGDEGELAYLGPDCEEVLLFTSDWEVDKDHSFSELSWKTRISGSSKVKTPLTRYHISLMPKAISEDKKEDYLLKIERFLEEKVEAEEVKVKVGKVDPNEALFYGRCLKTPLKINLLPSYALKVDYTLNLFANSYSQSVFLTERDNAVVIELDIEVNPLEDRGRVHQLVKNNEIGHYLRIDAKSSSLVVTMEGYLKGTYDAFREFQRNTYQEKTCWTTRSCRKFGPFKYSCRTHHHCRHYPVEKIEFKKMTASGHTKIHLSASDSHSEQEKDEFLNSLFAKFIMTNFNGKVSDQNNSLLIYQGDSLKKSAKIKEMIAQRVTEYVDKSSTLSPSFEKSSALESPEVDAFLRSERFKCLIAEGLTEIEMNGPCKQRGMK